MIGYAIQAHPFRRGWAESLSQELDAQIAWSPIAQPDENPKLLVWDTWKRAALLAAEDAEWAVVIQDDAIPAPDLRERLSAVLEDTPYPVVQTFYRIRPYATGMHRAAMRSTEQGGFAWPRILSAVCLAIRTSLLPQIIELCDEAHGPARDAPSRQLQDLGDDPRLDWALHRLKLEAWHVIPPLVSHREGPSLSAPTRLKHRPAWRWGPTVLAQSRDAAERTR